MQQFGYDSRVCHVVRLRCEWYRDRTPVGTHLGSGATGPRSPQPAVSTKHESRSSQPYSRLLLCFCHGVFCIRLRGYLPAAFHWWVADTFRPLQSAQALLWWPCWTWW